MISFIAPGNAIRASWLPEPSFLNSFFITLKSLVRLLLFKMPSQIPWIILFSIPWLYIGFLYGTEKIKITISTLFKKIAISFAFLAALCYILLFPACYVLSETGPDRSLSLIIFSISAFCSLWAFYIGYKCIRSKNYSEMLFYISVTVIILCISVTSIRQQKTVSLYAKALDQRTSYLLELQQKKNTKTVIVKVLPPSGFLYSAEISKDTNYFGNEHYKLGLFLDFNVKVNAK